MSELHTTSYGESGSRVVFLHGLFGQGRNWTQIAKALADEHRVLLVDLPDHGRSAWTERFDFVDVADRIATLLDPADPVALVGHSLGGKIAMMLALRHPHLVERLCVVDIAPVDHQNVSEFDGYIAGMRGMDLGALRTREDADRALEHAVRSPTVRSFLLQNLRRDGDSWRWQFNLEGLARDLGTIGGWPAGDVAGLAPYGGLVLWVDGADSGYVTDEAIPAMDALFPRNRRVTIKNAGHWVHSEQPETFVLVLRRFLDQHSG